jgi:hypothetical protein
MHTKLKLNKSLGRVLRYHERKMQQGKGECLYAGNMLKEAKELTPKEKHFFIDRLESLNDRIERKTLHIFLSWHKDDVLDNEKMRTISKEYMERMGLSKQPYLVYRHWDSTHPHAHIVSTNIRRDGRKIDLWQRQYFESMHISRELERKYGLYEAGKRLPDEEWARQHPVQKVVYGETPLKPTMNAVLEMTMTKYAYTSLEELNAVLRGYNMRASRGRDESVIRKGGGLLYYPLKDNGEKEDVYVKASALRCKPTLRNLLARFERNQQAHDDGRQRVQTTVDWIFYKQQVDAEAFRKALQKERIRVIDGAEGWFYLDEGTKAVYDGAKLGQRYSMEGIRARCIPEEEYRKAQELKKTQELRQQPRVDLY